MPNHLIAEKSPYLLQHAHNPVDWYPWGPTAFEKAKREDKPIFLSVGYSTCHWCHVMERESFESDELAKILNEYFVPIKVDREERQDVDRIYMTFVQASTGSGGWPMSVFLTPELKPFFGGTYFPPDNRYGRPGFAAILQSLARAWQADRTKIEDSGSQVIEQLKRYSEPGTSRGTLDRYVLDAAFNHLRRTFDSHYGGFGNAPKFPRPVVFNFLLRYHSSTGNDEALEMTLTTLRAMAEGGMYDQLGGGFHRYSVDERWFVPHFEKMLYDQAQLVISLLEAYQITRDEFFARIARETLDYVLRDMTDADGGFYSAEDADSVIDPAHPHEKGEGAFYVWSLPEMEALLGPEAAPFASRYGVRANGNVDSDPHGEFTGKNILAVTRPLEPMQENLGRAAAILLEARGKRVRPHLDDKILTAWNGLMISAFAKAAQVLGEPRYLEAARRAADFILTHMYNRETGVLLRRYRDGDASIPGFLDDYAFFVQGLLDLYETDFAVAHIETAVALTDRMLELFEDRANGGFYSTASGDSSLLLRMKDDYDGAEPSGNAIALLNLMRLGQLTNREDYRQVVERGFAALGAKIASQPMALPQMLVAFDYDAAPKRQVILCAPKQDALSGFLHAYRARFLPQTAIIVVDSGETRAKLAHWQPAIGAMQPVDAKPTAYVCENFACQLPTTELENFVALLK